MCASGPDLPLMLFLAYGNTGTTGGARICDHAFLFLTTI
jgi:hypothetical protein